MYSSAAAMEKEINSVSSNGLCETGEYLAQNNWYGQVKAMFVQIAL
jgi:hypothetical protein